MGRETAEDGNPARRLASPLTAQAQYDALVVLHDVLNVQDPHFAAPRPVAFLADAGAFAMEFVDGPNIPQLLDAARFEAAAAARRRAGGGGAAASRPYNRARAEFVRRPERPANHPLDDGKHVLQRMGLPLRQSWFDATRRPQHTQTSVLLHGHFAPENVVSRPARHIASTQPSPSAGRGS